MRLVAIGLAAGVFSAFFGVGGGIIAAAVAQAVEAAGHLLAERREVDLAGAAQAGVLLVPGVEAVLGLEGALEGRFELGVLEADVLEEAGLLLGIDAVEEVRQRAPHGAEQPEGIVEGPLDLGGGEAGFSGDACHGSWPFLLLLLRRAVWGPA